MRLILLVLSLALVSHVARADEDEPVVLVPARFVPLAVAPPQQRRLLDELHERRDSGRRMLNGGIVSTVVGTVLTGIGVGLFMANLCFAGCSNDDGAAAAAGAALIGFGQVGVVTGIPLWAAGQYRVSRAETMELALSAGGLSGKF